MTPKITLTEAMSEPKLFGKVFGNPSFWTWKVVAKLIDGLPLTEQREVELFEQCTGRKYTHRRWRRLIILAGRRAGKDRFEFAVAVWRAALCCDWNKHQSAGEGAVCILLGADKKQAAILRKYCAGLLEARMLQATVTRTTGDVTEFRNGASLEISTNDHRLVRGRSAIAVLGSETCHWKTSEHAASSDEEVVAAAVPSMAMCPDGGILMLGSSVYRKQGFMYRQYRDLFGNDEADAICWFAPSIVMNPKLPQHVVDEALAADAQRARAEYENVWREDLSDFIPADVIDAATDPQYERQPMTGVSYHAHADAAGGTGTDSFAFAIAHRDGANYILDLIREYKPRFSTAEVIAQLALVCRQYGINEVGGDSYAIGFHQAEWAAHSINFVGCERTTSHNYLTLLPQLMAKRVRLLNNKTLRHQLGSLERKVGASDREFVSHPAYANAHDDVACAAAGALVATGAEPIYNLDVFSPSYVDPDTTPEQQRAREYNMGLAQQIFAYSGGRFWPR